MGEERQGEAVASVRPSIDRLLSKNEDHAFSRYSAFC